MTNIFEESAGASEEWGDLYSIYRLIRTSLDVPTLQFQFEIEEGSFARPMVYLHYIDSRVRSVNHTTKFVDHVVQASIYTDTLWLAHSYAGTLKNALSGWPQTYIPKYSFQGSTPEPISWTGVDRDGFDVAASFGSYIRIDPDSVHSEQVQSPDRKWAVHITFNVSSPRFRDQTDAPLLASITFTQLQSLAQIPRFVSTGMRIGSSVS